MLAPDLEKTTAALTKSFSAAQIVTVYCGAMRFVIGPQIVAQNFPSWFNPVKAAIDKAVSHGSEWMDDLCIDLTTAVPQTIISFNAKFQETTDALMNLQTEIAMGSGTATPQQQRQAIDLFNQLKSDLAVLTPVTKADQMRITALLGAIQADYKALSDLSALVANSVPNGGTISQQVTADLGDDFLDITPNGPCLVSISIKTNVDAKIKRTAGANTEILPYLITLAILKKALDDNANATLAFSQVLNVWGFMAGLVDITLEDLTKGAAKDVIDVLREAMLQAAQDVWAQLAQTAQSLSRPS